MTPARPVRPIGYYQPLIDRTDAEPPVEPADYTEKKYILTEQEFMKKYSEKKTLVQKIKSIFKRRKL